MISSSKLINLSRKWQKMAFIRRRILSFPRINSRTKADCSATPGNFVVYTIDDQRFVIPLTYLRCKIFGELLKKSEETFGLPSQGPITLPCDASFMEYIVSLIKKGLAKDIEIALITSVENGCFSTSAGLHQIPTGQPLLVCGYRRRNFQWCK